MKVAATRTMTYTTVGGSDQQKLTIRVGVPYLLQDGDVDFAFTPGTAGCAVVYEGLEEANVGDVYGADEVQAIELAVAGIDSNLGRLRNKYEFYFESGEPYSEAE